MKKTLILLLLTLAAVPVMAQVSKPVPTPVEAEPIACPIGNLFQIQPGFSGAGDVYGNSGADATTCALIATPGGSPGGPYLPLAGGTMNNNAAIAFQGTGAATTLSNLGGEPSQVRGVMVSPNCGTQPNCYLTPDNGQFVWDDCTWANGSPNVSCSVTSFTAADVGKLAFATNASRYGYTYQLSTAVGCNGTIASVTDAHDVVLSANCTAVSSNDHPFFWGSDDTTALTTAWTAAVAQCSTLLLPGENAQGTGASFLFLQSPIFSTATGVPTNANCALGTEAMRRGVGIIGQGIHASYLFITPNFNLAACTHGYSGHACNAINDGANLQNFSVFGGGNANPTGANGNIVLLEIDYQGLAAGATAGNNTIFNLSMMGYGGGSSGIGYGIRLDGGTTLATYLTSDGVGQIGVYVDNGALVATESEFYDNWYNNLLLTAAASANISSSYGGYTSITSSGCDFATIGGVLSLVNDQIGIGTTPGAEQNGICAGYNHGPTGSGTIYVTNSVIDVGTTASASAAYIVGTGSALYAINSKFIGYNGVYNSQHFYNLGGSTLSGTGGAAYTCSSCVDQVSVAASVGSISGAVGGFFQGEPSPNSGNEFSGQFTSGTSGTVTVVITPGQTAQHGWKCGANDITTPADAIQQTASSTTTCTVSGTMVSSDLILWSAIAN